MKRLNKIHALLTALLLLITLLALCGCTGETLGLSDGEYVMPEEPTPSGSPDNAQKVPPREDDKNPETISEAPDEPVSSDDDITMSPIEENSIILTAQSLLGIEFSDGGSSPEEGFDNSGFIYYVLRANGYINSPRGLQEQVVMGNRVDMISELKSGDLVFFSENEERAQFGGIYIGDGVMIACRMPGESVKEFDISGSYYRDNFFAGVRVI